MEQYSELQQLSNESESNDLLDTKNCEQNKDIHEYSQMKYNEQYKQLEDFVMNKDALGLRQIIKQDIKLLWAEIQPSKSIFDLIVKDGFEEIMKELVNLIKNEMNHFIVKKFVKKMAKHGKNLVENQAFLEQANQFDGKAQQKQSKEDELQQKTQNSYMDSFFNGFSSFFSFSSDYKLTQDRIKELTDKFEIDKSNQKKWTIYRTTDIIDIPDIISLGIHQNIQELKLNQGYITNYEDFLYLNA